MSYLDDYKARINLKGGSAKGSLIKTTKDLLSKKIKDSPSYYEIYINDSIAPTGVLITDDSKEKEQKVVVDPSSTLGTGNVVKWNGINWLVLNSDKLETYHRGIIKKCESSLKWLDSQGQEKETPFTLKTSPSSAYGLEEDKIMILSKERRTILIQSNADTQQIKKDKRFIFDDRAWRVVGYNGLTEGLLELTLEEDVFNDAIDNKDLRIADYYNNLHTYTLEVTNGDSFAIDVGSTVQLNVVVKDNGTIVNSPTLTFSSSDAAIATVDNSGLVTGVAQGTVTITCTLASDNTVQDSIAVNVQSVPVDNYAITITSTSTTPNEIKYGQSKTYTVQVSNNGVRITDGSQPVSWSLWDDSKTTSTTLATIMSQDGYSCIVKNNNANNEHVQLKATLQGDPTVVAWLRIQMKPLF